MKKMFIVPIIVVVIVVVAVILLNVSESSYPPNVSLHGCTPILGIVEQDRIINDGKICVFEKQTPSPSDTINISVYDPKNPNSTEHSFTVASILIEKSGDCREMKLATNPDENCCWADSRIFLSSENRAYACETMGAV